MSQYSEKLRFSFIPLLMLFLPCCAISVFMERQDVWPAALIAVGMVTVTCVLLFIARNWEDLLAGVLASLLLIGILMGCALIPFVGWIADVLIFLFALTSIFASIAALIPYALKGMIIWAVFLIALCPAVFHPVASPAVIFVLCIGLGSALARKARPFDEFILLMSSIPLLAVAIASLGKLLQSGIVMRNAQFQQNVSGYTTRAGVQVGDYTRTITKAIPVLSTSVNPAAAAIGAATGSAASDAAES